MAEVAIVAGLVTDFFTQLHLNATFRMDIQNFVGKSLRIKLIDDRVVDGTLSVIDSFGNLLLSNVFEMSRDKLDQSKVHRRALGLVSVPKNQVQKVLLEK